MPSHIARDVGPRALLLGAILVVHAGLWALALTAQPTFTPARQLIAEGCSTLAIVAMSVNLMLSTRARPLERSLQGLDKLFVTHRTIGLSVAVLVSTHFTLVLKTRGYVIAKPFGYTTIALLLTAIFMASAPRFPWRRLVPLKYQTWKFTHRFMGVIVALGVTHSLLGHPYVRTVPLLRVYVYGFAAVGLTAWLYRELLFARLGPFRDYQVGRTRVLGDNITEITLDSSASLSRVAGQFAFASFAGGPTLEQHPFTISSGAADDIRFSIRASGDFTEQLLSGMPTSSAVRVEGPYGAFDYRRGQPHQLWLAGGIGITPFLAMAEDIGAATSVTLIWSVRTEREAIYQQELAAAATRNPNLEFRVHCTAEQGHLDVGALVLEARPEEYSAFICGPVPMRQNLVRQLKALGVPRGEVFFEEFRLR